jgi:hypothetical protein
MQPDKKEDTMFVNSVSPKVVCPHLGHKRYQCASPACQKVFLVALGYVYPFYGLVETVVKGKKVTVLKTLGHFYCSLKCLCYAEAPYNEEVL